MPKIVELRQDRSLINPAFDGYKLSLNAVPILRQALIVAPQKSEANEDQFSLLHSELFAMQNLLQVDPWARNMSYIINRLGEVVRSNYDETTGRPDALQIVYTIRDDNTTEHRITGDYNYSMRFISEKYCVICNGIQQLVLLDTGNRVKGQEWKEIAKTNIKITFEDKDERNFMLYDSRLDIIQEQKQISLALGRVQRVQISSCGAHYMHLHWAKWILKDEWIFEVVETLEGKGSLYYCAFEPRAESLIISSNREFQFRSQKKTAATIEMECDDKPKLNEGNGDISGFTWAQTDDDIVVKFDVQLGKDKTDYSVKCTTKKLTVKCAEDILFDYELFAKVDQDLTTWTIENNFVQIILVKQISDLFWTSLLASGTGPKESLDNGTQTCLPLEQQPIPNLEAPIEDCDFPIGIIQDEIKIDRFNLPTKTVTHSALLGSTPPLFTTSLRPGYPAALATRLDVDACLWLQQYNPSKPDEWSLRHEGNLHAFGYVQASKQQKKFIDCSPDLNYAIICESHRHIFLYKSKHDSANGLRKRNGPQVTIGKQHLITLEDTSEVLGIATSSGVITLLTAECLLYLQIN